MFLTGFALLFSQHQFISDTFRLPCFRTSLDESCALKALNVNKEGENVVFILVKYALQVSV